MQSWQIKALELEASALSHLDGFMREHAICFFIGAIYLLLALLAGSFGVGVEWWIATKTIKGQTHASCDGAHWNANTNWTANVAARTV